MKKVLYFSFTLLLLTISCTQLKRLELKDYPITPVSRENYKELNGTYLNRSDTACGTSYDSRVDRSDIPVTDDDLIRTLITKIPESVDLDQGESVKIEFTSRKKATIGYYRVDKLLFSKVISGKFKNGYFYRRTKWYLIPFFPLFARYENDQVRIGKSGDKLIVDSYYKSFGLYFIAGGSNRGRTKAVYPIKKETVQKDK
ncbi:hypothetical protein [Fluviicola sp.]|uniref:hypothetical protein n=1 Tax=Fluviicola sp. TaxID=1917219 RepID=UPI003D2D0EEB